MRKLDVTFITTPDLVARKFDKAAPLLLPVIKEAARGEFDLEDVRRMVCDGKAIVALVEDKGEPMLALAFHFTHYPQNLAINVMALGGRDTEVAAAEYWPRFKAWAREAGATMIEASCSEAMARMLRRFEFEPTYRVVRMPL